MAPKELNFITGNAKKLAEVQTILSSTPVRLRSQAIDLLEIQGTIEEISQHKAKTAAEAVRTCTSLICTPAHAGCGWLEELWVE